MRRRFASQAPRQPRVTTSVFRSRSRWFSALAERRPHAEPWEIGGTCPHLVLWRAEDRACRAQSRRRDSWSLLGAPRRPSRARKLSPVGESDARCFSGARNGSQAPASHRVGRSQPRVGLANPAWVGLNSWVSFFAFRTAVAELLTMPCLPGPWPPSAPWVLNTAPSDHD